MTMHSMPDQRIPTAYSYVRFSSAGQREGTSVERQVQLGREWAEQNGYEYAAEKFEDLGVSGYTGANLAEGGDLARFLNAVKAGTIERGSVLLIERFDRFSRQKRRIAQRLLEDIIVAGVDVVTTHNGKRYTEELIDNELGATLEIILGFQAAHEYSKTLSERVGRAWSKNTDRVLEGKRKRSRKVPAWINCEGDALESVEFSVIEEKADVVREIFKRYADGEPTNAIATDLRNRCIPTLSGRGRWTGPLIYMQVREVTPYGTLQMGEGSKKDRKITEIIKDYYPPIVDEEIARRVRHRIQNGAAVLKVKQQGQCRGRLVGVLRSSEGNKAKAKRNNRSVSYVDYVTNKYLGAVSYIDQVLVDEWPQVVDAFGVETNAEAEVLEAELSEAIFNFDYLTDRAEKRPSSALDRLILAAEAEVEQCQIKLQAATRSTRVYGSVPSEIALLPIPEANQWVRKLVEEAKVYREGRGANQRISISLRLKNGIMMSIGDASVGLRPRS